MLRFLDLGVFVFEFWVLRFRSRVLRFRDLGASCFGLRFRVLRFRNYQQASRANMTHNMDMLIKLPGIVSGNRLSIIYKIAFV